MPKRPNGIGYTSPIIAMRLKPHTYKKLEKEAKKRDRPIAYVAREYMLKALEAADEFNRIQEEVTALENKKRRIRV